MKRIVLGTVCFAAAAAVMLGQDSSKKVLHPEMTVAAGAGTFEAPAAKLGDANAQAWTETTVAAGVDKTPEPGKTVTVTGEIIDLSCYFQLGKHGEKHKSCGTKCITNNQPIGLLAKDGAVYMLIEEEHDPRRDGQVALRQAAIENFAKIVEVTGTEAGHAGFKAIYVQGFVKK